MPKLKTKSSAKKRLRVTASGKVKMKPSNTRHRLISKPKKMKRQARGTEIMNDSDAAKVVAHYLPYARKKRTRSDRNARLALRTPETLQMIEGEAA